MPKPPREVAAGPARKTAGFLLASVVGLALISTIVYWVLHPPVRPGASKVVVGTLDEIYYSHSATEADATSLGRALQSTGFFNNRGTTVLLSKGTSGTIISFALNNGAWDHPGTVLSFEEIGRRVANAVGGFPVRLRLSDSKWGVHKEVMVGKVTIGAKDEVYYFGAASNADAESLGRALQNNGYLVDTGASVELSKDGVTAIAFVVGDGAWRLPGTVTGFESLMRKVAPSVGGLPIDLRLLNSSMEVEWEVKGIH